MDTKAAQQKNTLSQDYFWNPQEQTLTYIEHDNDGHHLYMEIAGWQGQFVHFETDKCLANKPAYSEVQLAALRHTASENLKNIAINQLYNSHISILLHANNHHVNALLKTCPEQIKKHLNYYPGIKVPLLVVLSKSEVLQALFKGNHAYAVLIIISAYKTQLNLEQLESLLANNRDVLVESFGFHPSFYSLLTRVSKVAFPGFLNASFSHLMKDEKLIRALSSLTDARLRKVIANISYLRKFETSVFIEELLRNGPYAVQYLKNLSCSEEDHERLVASNSFQDLILNIRALKKSYRWRLLREYYRECLSYKKLVLEYFSFNCKGKTTELEFPPAPFKGSSCIVPLSSEIDVFRAYRHVPRIFCLTEFWQIYNCTKYFYLYQGEGSYIVEISINNAYDAEISQYYVERAWLPIGAKIPQVESWLKQEKKGYLASFQGKKKFIFNYFKYIFLAPILYPATVIILTGTMIVRPRFDEFGKKKPLTILSFLSGLKKELKYIFGDIEAMRPSK